MKPGTTRRRWTLKSLSIEADPAYVPPVLEGGWPGAATALKVYMVLLLALPQQLIVAPLGFAGSPASIWGIGCFLWWVWYHVNRSHRAGEPRAARWAALLFLAAILISYTRAMSAPMAADELNVADGGLLRVLGWLGVLLLAADGISDLDDWRRVLDWFMMLVGLLALLGIAQALTGQAWVDKISIPGLVSNAPFELTAPRDGQPRPVGTATHAIEFGQSLTMGLLVSSAAASVRATLLNRSVALLCAGSAILVVSRSAVVSIIVGFAILGSALTRRQKFQSALLGVLVLLAVFMLRPGLIGTLTRMFTGVEDDASARSRTDSYAYALHALASHPLVGKGFGTFLPKYRTLDNQWLLSAIEIGAVGVVALILLMTAVVTSGFLSERRLDSRADRVVARGLSASILAVCVGMLFYDGFSFPQATGLLFVVCGFAAAAFRISSVPAPREPRLSRGEVSRRAGG